MNKWKVNNKYERVYKNQQREEREKALKDYEGMLKNPHDPWRISVFASWTDEEITMMIQLLRDSLCSQRTK